MNELMKHYSLLTLAWVFIGLGLYMIYFNRLESKMNQKIFKKRMERAEVELETAKLIFKNMMEKYSETSNKEVSKSKL